MTSALPTRAESGAPWIEALASLAQHRVLTTAQVHAMHLPGRRVRQAQRLMAELGGEGLVDRAVGLGAQRVWFATARGIEAVRSAGALEGEPPLLDRRSAAGRLMAHTLAVNDVGIAFMVAARERGEEFGALSWRHEVAHPLSAPARRRRRRWKAADAVLTYLRSEGSETVVEQRFLELDRATRPAEGLARELALYGRLRRAEGPGGRPLWRDRFPAFPSVLCVLAGSRADLLRRRRDAVSAFLRADPEIGSSAQPPIRIGLLEDLCASGPFAPVFEEAREPGREIDWLGREG
ncbi:MAG: replication-relaxation family protein [Actinobacteria bacterium]|nr:replication-relaxation family protein [Actinomycetota bacterium]